MQVYEQNKNKNPETKPPSSQATLPGPPPRKFFLWAETPCVWKTYRLYPFTWWLMKTRNTVIERSSLNILNL